VSDFILVRISAIRQVIPFSARDGLGWFIMWIMDKANQKKLNSSNVIKIKNTQVAADLNITVQTVITYKARLQDAGIIRKVKGQSLYLISQDYIYKGKMLNK